MRTLLVLEQRYFQPRLGERDPLKLVEVLHLLPSPLAQDGVGECEEAAAGANLLGVSPGRKLLACLHLLVDGLAELFNVDARQVKLTDLLLERHAAQ